MITVELEYEEIEKFVLKAVERKLETIKSKYHRSAGKTKSGMGDWDLEIEACLAEGAAAKGLKLPWVAEVNTFHAPDVGKHQVRWTSWKNGYLHFRPGDKKKEIFILVTGKAGIYQLVGWLYGWEAADIAEEQTGNDKFMHEYRMVQKKLHPIEELPDGAIQTRNEAS